MITSYHFADLEDGRPITAYKITNRWGEYAVILNYGAVIQSLVVKDRDGNLGDVVLGPDEGQAPGFMCRPASVMGRAANRIAYGKFTIDGKEYQLKIARGEHHLHGNTGNYAGQFFDVTPGDDCVTLSLLDTGEDGWECTCDTHITYTFTDNHSLTIDYSITAHGSTVICPTNHAYFNLDYPNEILDTKLKIFTDNYAPKSAIGMPDGRRAPVAGTPMDFSKGMTFAEGFASDKIGFFPEGRLGYDDFFVLPDDGFRQVAEAVNPNSGRRMRVFSDAEGLTLFTPSGAFGPTPNKYGKILEGFTSFCLETQYVPNAVNCEGYQSPVFRDGETMHSTTVYAFDTVAK